ncbi:ATP-binding cassette domain-containing protein [Rubrolithibacter danxiaensis]|uniref:ATP-binding cassette domain-containing protein n=1 Tax=Rubrolithibacter danxiaensis TaxID=3390805 RepID=UPI003BF7B18D
MFLLIENLTVRHLDKVLLHDLNLEISEGQQWAVVGESGSGKTALLEAIAGNFNIQKGQIKHCYHENYPHSTNLQFNINNLISFVKQKHSFKNRSNTTDFYYQQRFNSFDSKDAPTVRSYLESIKPVIAASTYWTFDYTTERLKLKELLDKELIKLSNGETKRLLIAASLIKNPKLLLLDNPFTGLDADTRPYLRKLIKEIIDSGITVIIATSPTEIPDSITHIAVLKDGTITQKVEKAAFNPDSVIAKSADHPDTDLLTDLLSLTEKPVFKKIVHMENVTVKYGDKVILDDVNWKVENGEHWALTGHNGAGKSTLLSLINGDNPQAYANKITLFDRRRGSGESIWDIKKKTGYVSPEMLQYFKAGSSCIHVVESGFYDTMGLFRASNTKNSGIAAQWMKVLKIDSFAHTPFKNVSASVQRLCLLARALVKNPVLLILDEPCQGLDENQQHYFQSLIDTICKISNTALIYVTHYHEELPLCVTKQLKLEKGKVVS